MNIYCTGLENRYGTYKNETEIKNIVELPIMKDYFVLDLKYGCMHQKDNYLKCCLIIVTIII